jgi:hypothetical protein
VLGHDLPAGCTRGCARSQCISIIAARRPLELRPDENCSLDRGGKLDQFPGRVLPAL